MKTAVIGAGAAGMMFAALADKEKEEITLFEKMPRCGIKLGITGKGRCNVTTASTPAEMTEFISRGKKFLRPAVYSFTPQDTVAFFEENGVKLKTERGGRVFPQSDKAGDIVSALLKKAEQNAFLIHSKVKKISKTGDKFCITAENGTYFFDKVVIATGGRSYPKTGSDGDGYRFAKEFGIAVIPPRPALVPLLAEEKYCADLMGVTLKNVKTTFFSESGKKAYEDFGEMLFTHFGVSGPVILSASSELSFENGEKYRLEIDLKPALDEKTLDARILRDFAEVKNRDFSNSLSRLLPNKMIPTVISLSGIAPEKKVNSVTKEERSRLSRVLKHFPVTVTGTRPIDEAIVTAGGVDTSEIDPRSMESKKVKGLYFIGEVLDADAKTGGYNLQIAFSTAKSAVRHIENQKEN